MPKGDIVIDGIGYILQRGSGSEMDPSDRYNVTIKIWISKVFLIAFIHLSR